VQGGAGLNFAGAGRVRTQNFNPCRTLGSIPGREIALCMLVVTPLAFWECDWSIVPMEALLRA